MIYVPAARRLGVSALIAASGLTGGCGDGPTAPTVELPAVEQVNLSSSQAGQAPVVNPNLTNPWGIAINPVSGLVWVSNNRSGTLSAYSPGGVLASGAVQVPSGVTGAGGAPTGIVYAATLDFFIPGFGPAQYLIAGEDGVISGWNIVSGNARVVVNRAAELASYRGITVAGSTVYAANFRGKVVEAFDRFFGLVTSFTDPDLPPDYGPVNVQNLAGMLFVAFAKQDAATGEPVVGAGNGYLSVFSPAGTLLRRFASNGALNAPWGLAIAPASFGNFAGSVLVGNSGDGRINVFDAEGTWRGALRDAEEDPIVIPGLWGLAVGPNGLLYFAAGLGGEANGLFGTLTPR